MSHSVVWSLFLLLFFQPHAQSAILGSPDILTRATSSASGQAPSILNKSGGTRAKDPSGDGLVPQQDDHTDTMPPWIAVEERNIHELSLLSHLRSEKDASGKQASIAPQLYVMP